jgi:hypothetical protein
MQWTVRTVKHLTVQFSACSSWFGMQLSHRSLVLALGAVCYILQSTTPSPPDKLSVSTWQYATAASILILSNLLFSNRPRIWRHTLWPTDNLTIHAMTYWQFDDTHYDLLTIWRYTLWATDNLTIHTMSYWQSDDTHYDLLTIWRYTLWATDNLTIHTMTYWQFDDTLYELLTICCGHFVVNRNS